MLFWGVGFEPRRTAEHLRSLKIKEVNILIFHHVSRFVSKRFTPEVGRFFFLAFAFPNQIMAQLDRIVLPPPLHFISGRDSWIH